MTTNSFVVGYYYKYYYYYSFTNLNIIALLQHGTVRPYYIQLYSCTAVQLYGRTYIRHRLQSIQQRSTGRLLLTSTPVCSQTPPGAELAACRP